MRRKSRFGLERTRSLGLHLVSIAALLGGALLLLADSDIPKCEESTFKAKLSVETCCGQSEVAELAIAHDGEMLAQQGRGSVAGALILRATLSSDCLDRDEKAKPVGLKYELLVCDQPCELWHMLRDGKLSKVEEKCNLGEGNMCDVTITPIK